MSSDCYDEDDLLLVGPAAEMVGVHPDTLRRWADAGRVPVSRTPTNQRRFLVRHLRELIRPEHVAGDQPSSDPEQRAREQPHAVQVAARGAA